MEPSVDHHRSESDNSSHLSFDKISFRFLKEGNYTVLCLFCKRVDERNCSLSRPVNRALEICVVHWTAEICGDPECWS